MAEQFSEMAWFVARSAWGILPVFVLSVSLGVLVRALKLDGAIRRAFSHRVGVSILLATAVGAFSPFCSCTVIPVVAGLLMGGVPLAPVMAFWVASPTMDPEIFALSVGFLGWDLAVTRLAATLLLSLGRATSPSRSPGAACWGRCCGARRFPPGRRRPAGAAAQERRPHGGSSR